jgi:sensor c-di-GMP phosphodiesterase-like protein
MAKSLNLEVVVEGIETEQQANYFFHPKQTLYGQGWLYGHPVKVEEFHRLLAEDGERARVPVGTSAMRNEQTDAVRIAHTYVA